MVSEVLWNEWSDKQQVSKYSEEWGFYNSGCLVCTICFSLNVTKVTAFPALIVPVPFKVKHMMLFVRKGFSLVPICFSSLDFYVNSLGQTTQATYTLPPSWLQIRDRKQCLWCAVGDSTLHRWGTSANPLCAFIMNMHLWQTAACKTLWGDREVAQLSYRLSSMYKALSSNTSSIETSIVVHAYI